MNIIGVDVGLSGAVSLIQDGELLWSSEMPTVSVERNGKKKRDVDYAILGGLLRRGMEWDSLAFVEKTGSMPGQGLSSTYAFGKSTGAVLGALGALGWRIQEVPPQRWKKHFGLVGKDKDQARILAIKKFPNLANIFAKKKSIGLADASLIALYGWETRN